jgi:hypothetical protein
LGGEGGSADRSDDPAGGWVDGDQRARVVLACCAAVWASGIMAVRIVSPEYSWAAPMIGSSSRFTASM